MSKNIEVGKFTLESLTTGMYSDPLIVFREYIQNSVDALEEAVVEELIDSQYMRIDIIIDDDLKNITINDNGIGIHSSIAVNKLLSVGASQKSHTMNRGFRGIGRLGGLSYCDTLEFITTSYDDDKETTVRFDCKLLRSLLVPNDDQKISMEEIIDKVSSYEYNPVEKSSHYFIVKMTNVGHHQILDEKLVKSYISQVAPVPYYKKRFIYSDEIKNHLKNINVQVTEFPIYLGDSSATLTPLYKPLKSRFSAGRGEDNGPDDMTSAEYFQVRNKNNELLCAGWFSISSFLGTIKDPEIKGLRFRKGNIQIGDSITSDKLFKGTNTRFNGWVQGEIFVVYDSLVPNARRDDFEQTDDYYNMMSKLSNNVALKIQSYCYSASRNRNDKDLKAITTAKRQIAQKKQRIEKGFNSSVEKERAVKDIEDRISEVVKIKDTGKVDKSSKDDVLRQLEEVKGNIVEESNYKIASISRFGRKAQHVLRVVNDIMSLYLSEDVVDKIVDETVAKLNKQDIDKRTK